MNESAAEARERLEQEAVAWWVRSTSGEMTADERARFEAWRDRCPAHAKAYRRIEKLWQLLDQPLRADRERRRWQGGSAIEPAPAAPAARRDTLRSARLRRWGLGLSVAASLFLAIGFTLFPDYLQHPLADYRTRIGEQASFHLADGSTVHLNTDTALDVHLESGERRVVLLRGEAEFEVAPDRRRPFRVKAGDTTLEVLGTRFVVRHEAGEGRVTLLEGRLRLIRDSAEGGIGQTVDLGPGEEMAFDDRRLGEARTANPASADAWRRGRLVMNFATLRDVLEELNRYRRGPVRLLNPALARREINVAIDIDRIDAWLDALTETLPVRVHRAGPLVFLH